MPPLTPPRWQGGKSRIRLRLLIALVATDIAALAMSVLPVLAFGPHSARFMQGVTFMTAAAPLYFLVAVSSDAYSVAALGRRSISVSSALRALVAAVAMVLFVAFYLKASAQLSRAALATAVIAATILIPAGRLMVDRAARRWLGSDPLQVVTICDTVAPTLPTAFTAFVDSTDLAAFDRHDPTARERFARLVGGADRVVVTCPPERRQFWAAVLRGASVQGEILAEELDHLGAIGMGQHAGASTIVMSLRPLGIRDRAIKRAFDLATTILALPVLLPVLLAVALAVKLQDGGPVLFVQARLGLDNRRFNIFKFRTMRAEVADPHGNRSTHRQDSRITRVGRFLRATSLDELPQLLNVLLGEMSIVGPRPHALGSTAESELFWMVDERYWERHLIKPGLTGLAQVRGYRGATHLRADLVNRLQSDLEYSVGWTIWRDVAIVMRTFGVLLHRNAF